MRSARLKEWTAAEIALVSAALDDIAGTDLGRQIIDRALSNGFRTLRRFVRAARLDGDRGYQAEEPTVATAHHDEQNGIKTIDLTDRFFERQSLRDQFSGPPGYLLTTEILAHELVHAVDMDQRYSGTETFRRSVRLGMPAALQAEVDAANAARRPLVDAGRHADDWYASRSFAIVRLRGGCRRCTRSKGIARRSPKSAPIWCSTRTPVRSSSPGSSSTSRARCPGKHRDPDPGIQVNPVPSSAARPGTHACGRRPRARAARAAGRGGAPDCRRGPAC